MSKLSEYMALNGLVYKIVLDLQLVDAKSQWNTTYPEGYCGFTQSFEANTGTVLQLGNNCYLPSSSQSIIYLASYYLMLYSLDAKNIVK